MYSLNDRKVHIWPIIVLIGAFVVALVANKLQYTEQEGAEKDDQAST